MKNRSSSLSLSSLSSLKMERVSTIVLVILSIAFIIIGEYGRRQVLKSNPCGMTFSTRERKRISVDSIIDGVTFKGIDHYNNNASDTIFKLWKYSNPKSKKLNMYPVLFIPGNMGNADQVRSFASYMHNGDDYFQYFALDFNESLSAIHGSLIIQQAIYLNEALQEIITLYKNYDDYNKIPKIMLIGHSIGGIVARTALLLDNHPRCIVSDIIMIGTPNRYPAYSPDSSMEVMYESVNKAWRNSFYNESINCKASASASRSFDNSDDYHDKKIVTADYKCPVCAAKIRLISVSGGDIDILVPPDLTRLEGIAPFPTNSTSASTKPVSISSQIVNMMIFPTKIPQFIFNIGKNYYSSFMANTNSTIDGKANNVTDNNTTISKTNESLPLDTCSEGNMTCSDKDIAKNDTKTSTLSYYESVTLDEWKLHMTSYIEPQHISIRTSDLLDVGYPIDHDAMLWCKELVRTLSLAMRKLTKYPYDESSQSFKKFNIYKLFKYNSSKKIPGVENMIAPVRDYLNRKESYNMWKQADVKDHKHIKSIVPGGDIVVLAITFVSSHLTKAFFCYMMISCLSITIPLVRSITGHATIGSSLNDLNTLRPWVHLHLDVLYPLLDKSIVSLLPLPLYELVTKLFPSSRIYIITSVLVVLKVVYDYWMNPQTSFHYYGNILEWIMAYGLAIAIRLLILIIIYAIRSIFNVFKNVISVILKRTIWTKSTRKTVKKLVKDSKINFSIVTMIIMMCIVTVTIIYYTNNRLHDLKVVLYYLSISKIVLIVSIGLSLMYSLLFPPDDSESYFNHTQYVLLYLPLPVLIGSSLYYSVMLLFGHSITYTNALNLYELFMPEEFNINILLLSICIHLILTRRNGYFNYKVESNTPISDALGNSNHDNDNGNEKSNVNNVVKNKCCHEDGGVDAIYEKVSNNDGSEILVEIAPGVILGPTYRVISCKCSSKYSMDQSKWCEWCLCEKCSGNKIKTYNNDDNDTLSQSFSNEFATNALHFIGIIMIIGYAYQNAIVFPHKLFNMIGYISLSFLARDLSISLNIMKHLK